MRVPGGPNPIRRRGGLSLRQAIQRRLIKEEIKAKFRAGLSTFATELLDVAKQLSSGTVDSALAGRPYSRIRPNPAFDPRLINVGFGKHRGRRFADSWEILPPSQGIGIRNTSYAGPFLEHGTRTMVRRPIEELIKARANQIYKGHLDRAFSSSGTVTTLVPAPYLLRPTAS